MATPAGRMVMPPPSMAPPVQPAPPMSVRVAAPVTTPPERLKLGTDSGVLSTIVPPVRLTRPAPLNTNDAGELNVCVPAPNVRPAPVATANAPVCVEELVLLLITSV